MKLTDSRDIAAAPEVVWTAILDPEVLRVCIPGCDSLTGSVQEGYTAVVRQKVGPVSATFTGIVTLSDIQAPRALRISGEGKGGVAGYARGGASVALAPSERGTLLTYDAEAAVGGKIAQLGSRLIDSFARKMADDFFTRFQDAVEGPDPEAETEMTVAGDAPRKGWFRRLTGT
jgi:uncharacterized protein